MSTRMPGESYRRRLRSLLLYLCYVFRTLINSLVCRYLVSAARFKIQDYFIISSQKLNTWLNTYHIAIDNKEDVPLVEFMYLVFTRMTGESYGRRLRFLLLCLCDVYLALINSLGC